jgi:carboxyl-terminal processing protease
VDRTTRSGSEVLAFALQRAGIPVVGTQTPGEVTAAKPFILSDASLLLVATSAVLVDGATLEGSGIQPDVAVQFDVAYAAGNDPQLDAALELAAVGRGQKDGAGTRVTLS